MGGFTAFRNHLFNLFPGVFRRNVNRETVFCVVILDLMQFLAGKVKYSGLGESNTFNAESIALSMRSVVEEYMNSGEYKATDSFIALFDTAKNVPTNKAHTQKKRQNTCSPQILDESTYNTLMEKNGTPSNGLGSLLKLPLEGDTIWRSNNLKFQLYCTITEELLKIKPSPGLKLVIDDGVSIHPALYVERREEMIIHYSFKDRSAYEQECLVSNLSRHHFTERFVIEHDKPVERLPQTCIGEADVKIPGLIVYSERKRFLVISQDTDLIFILLLHMKTLTPFPADFELWLDTQTPADRKMGVSRSYRFIDVKALYNAIIELFEREYPDVKNPIETLVFLVYTLETDFTSGFETCLTVTPAVVWNTFSALHTNPERFKENGYVLFNPHMYDETAGAKLDTSAKMGLKRSTERICVYPVKWRGVLNNAVEYGYELLHHVYNIVLDDVKCQSFLYLLCQLKVIDDLSSLGYTQFDRKNVPYRVYIPTSDEFFIWTGVIHAKLEAYRTDTSRTALEEEDKKRKGQLQLAEEITKKAKIVLPFVTQAKRRASKSLSQKPQSVVTANASANEVEEIEEMEIDRVSTITPNMVPSAAIKKKMEAMLKKEIPKDYGVPRLHAMIARIYRTQWVMNYHQNGWKIPLTYMTNFSDLHRDDITLSANGWKAREVEQNSESLKRGDFNNSYFTSVYQEGVIPGVIPFKVYEMVETDLIYNRNHTAYIDFGI